MTVSKFPAQLVIDTSVALKWYLEEDKSQTARIIYEGIKTGRIFGVAPEYLLIETANVLIKHYKISTQEVIEVIADLDSIGIEFIKQDIFDFRRLVNSAVKNNLAIYDGLFLECAYISGYKLITADRVLADADKKQIILL